MIEYFSLLVGGELTAMASMGDVNEEAGDASEEAESICSVLGVYDEVNMSKRQRT